MSATTKFESVWDALIDDPEDLKKKSDYLILIQARLHGMSGSMSDKAKSIELPVEQVRGLMNGRIQNYSLNELVSIARKAGVTTKL